ncbi:MAG: hypothetical protein LUD50_03205 [Clostridia bacterium]|nr:hypothetical protein [Clostridia bacterium]
MRIFVVSLMAAIAMLLILMLSFAGGLCIASLVSATVRIIRIIRKGRGKTILRLIRKY